MPATEVTEEIKNDLEVLQMRGALDPKRFYKKNANKELPKYFQVGRYVNNPVEFYSDRGKFYILKLIIFKKSLFRNFMEKFDRFFYTAILSCRIFVQILWKKQKELSESYQPELINLKTFYYYYYYF